MDDLTLRLRDRIRSCTACHLHTTSSQRVPWSGSTPSARAVLGQAPGWHEDKDGRPFVGPAGNMMKDAMRRAHLDPHSFAYLNPVNCFPGRQPGGDVRPDQRALEACNSLMWEQIAVIQPTVLVLAGETALHQFFPKYRLTHCHGRPLFWHGREHERPIWWREEGFMYLFVTYHPSSALRSIKLEKALYEDVEALATFLSSHYTWPEDCYVCKGEVAHFDASGFVRCELHAQVQLTLQV